MWNCMDVLARHLKRDYKVQTIINKPVSSNFYNFEFYYDDEKIGTSSDNILYALSTDDLDICDFSQKTGNYLLTSSTDHFPVLKHADEVNLVLVSNCKDPNRVFRSVHSCCRAFHGLEEHSTELLEAVFYKKETIQVLINVLADIVGHNVTLIDLEGNDVATSPTFAAPNAIRENAIYTEKDYNTFLANLDYPTVFQYPNWPDFLLSGVNSQNKIAFLLVGSAERGDIKEFELPLFESASQFLENCCQENLMVKSRLDRTADFFNAVIDGVLTEKKQITKNAAAIRLNLKKHNCFLMIFNSDPNIIYQDAYLILSEIQYNLLFNKLFIRHKKVIVLLSEDSQKALDTRIREYKKMVHGKKKDGWHVAQSFLFDDVQELSGAYQQCNACKKYGLQMAPKSTLYDYKDYMLFHLLNEASYQIDLKAFRLPLVQEIIDYDTANNTEYAVTLYYYIKMFGNVQAVAQKLNLHRNTVTYRVNRLAEVFSLDLSDYPLLNNIGITYDIMGCMQRD